jgi:integrase
VVACYLQQVQLESRADGIGASRVKEASSAISCYYWLHGLESPTTSITCGFVREVTRRILQGTQSNRAPISLDEMKTILDLYAHSNVHLMDRMHATVLLLMFAGCLRFDEAANISVDEAFMKFYDTHVCIFIPKSKTDQTMVGAWVPIARVGGQYCPVGNLELLLRQGLYLTSVGPAVDAGPLSRQVRFAGNKHVLKQVTSSVDDPIFALSYTRLLQRCKEFCVTAGIDNNITLHSFRMGAATQAYNNGVELSYIRSFGRWKSLSCPILYSRQNLDAYLHVNRALGLKSD